MPTKSNRKVTKEYVFIEAAPVRSFHPHLGPVVMTDSRLLFHMFRLISKCASRVIVENVNPNSDVFPLPTILPTSLFKVSIVPDHFAVEWERSVKKMAKEAESHTPIIDEPTTGAQPPAVRTDSNT